MKKKTQKVIVYAVWVSLKNMITETTLKENYEHYKTEL
jgi:hypothetical protein